MPYGIRLVNIQDVVRLRTRPLHHMPFTLKPDRRPSHALNHPKEQTHTHMSSSSPLRIRRRAHSNQPPKTNHKQENVFTISTYTSYEKNKYPRPALRHSRHLFSLDKKKTTTTTLLYPRTPENPRHPGSPPPLSPRTHSPKQRHPRTPNTRHQPTVDHSAVSAHLFTHT